MTGLATVIKKELKSFGADRSQFIIYTVMSAVWGLALFLSGNSDGDVGARFWCVFFAVIVTSVFSGTVFISERVSGTLEVLITSGVSRDAVFFGKLIFVASMSLAVGLLCAVFESAWCCVVSFDISFWRYFLRFGFSDVVLYAATVYLNAAVGAYLSVRMGNPRFLHFINVLITAVLVALYTWSTWSWSAPREHYWPVLSAGFMLIGALFTFLGRREFMGERITRPVIF